MIGYWITFFNGFLYVLAMIIGVSAMIIGVSAIGD
jgi:hypothetical protein